MNDSKAITKKTIEADDNAVMQASDALSYGELVAVPTETVYGLAANATVSDALNLIKSSTANKVDFSVISQRDILEEPAKDDGDADSSRCPRQRRKGRRAILRRPGHMPQTHEKTGPVKVDAAPVLKQKPVVKQEGFPILVNTESFNEAGKVIMARDRLGIKPLYLYKNSKCIL